MATVLLAVFCWGLAIAVQLFIVFLFYMLFKRFVIAAERQARALENLERGFRKPDEMQ
jgi:hypothetical protein